MSVIFTSILSTFLLALAVLPVASSPTMRPQNLIVYSPEITSPIASTIWRVGSTEHVTWSTSGIPSEKRNSNGTIFLGHITDDSENLEVSHPLAYGFPLDAGTVKVTVPNVRPRRDYIIVLFGDSGNTSPEFRITV